MEVKTHSCRSLRIWACAHGCHKQADSALKKGNKTGVFPARHTLVPKWGSMDSATPNQTTAGRHFKAHKNVNDKTRTRTGSLTADQFSSADDEHITAGIQHARVYSRLNNTAESEDPTRVITADEKKYAIADLDKKDWASLFEAPPEATRPRGGPCGVYLGYWRSWYSATRTGARSFFFGIPAARCFSNWYKKPLSDWPGLLLSDWPNYGHYRGFWFAHFGRF